MMTYTPARQHLGWELKPVRIGVMGAGSVGCYVGGRLSHAGYDVRFVGRQALGEEIQEHGLTLTSLDGFRCVVASPVWATEAATLADVDLLLVTVKGFATASVADELAAQLRPDCVVLSLQNGVANATTLAERLSVSRVWPCMVPFNVLRQGQGTFHQGTSGDLTTSRAVPADVQKAFSMAGLPLHLHGEMQGVLWGKLLFNLTDALNALADIPLKEQLADRLWRKVMSRAIAEGIAGLRAEGITPIAFLPIPPWAVVHLLRVPTWVFNRVAKTMIDIDPQARSSMWEDLQRGRTTEVHLLNGEVVALGARHGVPTPVNSAIVEAITAAERGEDTTALVSRLRDLG